MALELSATAGDKSAGPAKPWVLIVPDDVSEVTLKLATGDAAKMLSDVDWGASDAATPTSVTGEGTAEVTAVFAATGDFTWHFHPSAKVGDDEARERSNSIVVKRGSVVSEPEEPPAVPAPAVAEVAVGFYDKNFTLVTGVVAGVIGVAVLVVVGWIVTQIGLPDVVAKRPPVTTAPTVSEPFGSWLERVRAIIAIAAGGAGIMLLVFGAWMAALETRGRLKVETKLNLPGSDSLGMLNATSIASLDAITKAIGEALEKSITALKSTRGTIAVVVAGLVLVLLALVGTSTLELGVMPVPEPSPSV